MEIISHSGAENQSKTHLADVAVAQEGAVLSRALHQHLHNISRFIFFSFSFLKLFPSFLKHFHNFETEKKLTGRLSASSTLSSGFTMSSPYDFLEAHVQVHGDAILEEL